MSFGTIIVGMLLAAAVSFAIFIIVRDRRKGKHSCSFGCEGCAMKGSCDKENRT